MSAASPSSTTTLTVIKLAIGVTCFVATAVLTMLVTGAIESPARLGVGWLNERFGTAGLSTAMVLTFAGLLSFARWASRRDLRRQYEADRTIHVVPRRKVPKWIWYYVGGMVTVVVLGLVAALPPASPGQAARSGTALAPQTR